jgi:hypothetical protein
MTGPCGRASYCVESRVHASSSCQPIEFTKVAWVCTLANSGADKTHGSAVSILASLFGIPQEFGYTMQIRELLPHLLTLSCKCLEFWFYDMLLIPIYELHGAGRRDLSEQIIISAIILKILTHYTLGLHGHNWFFNWMILLRAMSAQLCWLTNSTTSNCFVTDLCVLLAHLVELLWMFAPLDVQYYNATICYDGDDLTRLLALFACNILLRFNQVYFNIHKCSLRCCQLVNWKEGLVR